MELGRRAFLLFSVAAVSGCAARKVLVLDARTQPNSTSIPIFVATTREATGGREIFGADRASEITWSRFAVSIPSSRKPGQVALAKNSPVDASTAFFASEAQVFAGSDAFRRSVENTLAQHPVGRREVAVYVHGFNNNFADGLFRKAQIMHDFDIPAVGVHYSWPSAGRASLYLYDRDSAFFARDGLAKLLRTLSKTGAQRIILYAHSMGAQVTVEAVRQLALEGAPEVFSRMNSVILLSPDVDLDLFRSEVINGSVRSITWFIFVSSKDKALQLSSRLRGGSERLGAITNVSEVADLNAVVIDLSQVKNDDPLGHETVAESPAMIAMVRGYNEHGPEIARQELAGLGLVETSVSAVGNASQIVFSPN